MDLGPIRDGLKEALGRIAGLRVDRGMSQQVNVPHALMKPAQLQRYDEIPLQMEVWILVGQQVSRAAEKNLDEYLADRGDKSVAQALLADPTLGDRVDDVSVVGWDSYGVVRFDVDQPAYLGARWLVHIIPKEWPE